jgi:hypothetical protein
MTRESGHTSASTSPPYSRLVTPGLLVVIAVALLAILFGLSPQLQLRGSSALKQLSRLPTTIQSTPVTSVSRPLSTFMSSSNQKTSAKEEKEWNHLAELMEYYHNHFRHSFNSIYEVCELIVCGGLPIDRRLTQHNSHRSSRMESLKSEGCLSGCSFRMQERWHHNLTCTTT